MPTNLWAIRVTNSSTLNPFVGSQQPTTQNIVNFFRSLSGRANATTIAGAYNQAKATGSVSLSSAGTSVTTTINGVAIVSTVGADDNATAAAMVTDITASTNPLVSKAVTASRTLTQAVGSFAISSATGSLSPQVGGTNCTFTATGVNADDAILLAAAINAEPTVARKVRAFANVDTAGAASSGTVALHAVGGATGSFLISSGSGTLIATINGVPVSITWASSDNASATALAAAINATPALMGVVHAVSSTGTVYVIASTDGVATDSITLHAEGTGLTVSAAMSSSRPYGGILGDAITLTSATGVTRSGANLTGGVTAVTLTSNVAGFGGNWVTLAASATTGTATASGARLTGGTETQVSYTYP